MSFACTRIIAGVTALVLWSGQGRGVPAAALQTALQTAPSSVDLPGLMARVGAYVERYYATAQRVVAVERITLQSLGADLAPAGFPRRLEYDLRIEWTPGEHGEPGTAQVRRHLVKVNGRAPRPKDEPGCSDPRTLSPEPLAMFLSGQQRDYVFTPVRTGRVSGRAVTMVDYRSVKTGAMQVSWHDDCVSVELPGRSAGRLWADPATGDVLRVDERLVGTFDVPVPPEQQRKGAAARLTIERSDTSIRYKPVQFREPDETVLMPSEVETLTVIRDAGIPRMRIRQVFSGYRRFVTEGRVLED